MTDSSPFLGNTGIVPGSPEPGGFFGPYRGVVTNTTDPAGQSRIKAVIPQLFGNTSTECDWALPCQLPGLLSVPSPGQGVWISFEGGDINYSGCTWVCGRQSLRLLLMIQQGRLFLLLVPLVPLL